MNLEARWLLSLIIKIILFQKNGLFIQNDLFIHTLLYSRLFKLSQRNFTKMKFTLEAVIKSAAETKRCSLLCGCYSDAVRVVLIKLRLM